MRSHGVLNSAQMELVPVQEGGRECYFYLNCRFKTYLCIVTYPFRFLSFGLEILFSDRVI